MNLGELCEYWAVWRPQAPAIRTRKTTTTWSELEDRTARIAGGLTAHGTGHGDRIGIYAANSLAWCELAIAALRIGAIVVPLNLRFTSCELLPVINDAQLSCIATIPRAPNATRRWRPTDLTLSRFPWIALRQRHCQSTRWRRRPGWRAEAASQRTT